MLNFFAKSKIDAQNLPDDLAQIVAVWLELPEHIKQAIKTLVKSAMGRK